MFASCLDPVLRTSIRDPVLFLPRDPDGKFLIRDPDKHTRLYILELSNIFLSKNS
jgi:hypothetical protein